jgi:2-desacetyl-2-hydroxyethyl bacteriochlorophyllide A dehydrogenase
VLGAVFHGPRDIRVEELPDPVAGPGEAVVRVRAAGICGGDLHEVRTGRQLYPTPYPRPPQGHELAGDVIAVGLGVTRVSPGDRVAVMPMISCGSCAVCRAGRFALCPELEHIGVARSGGFAELCLAPAGNLYPLPAVVGYEEAALLDCAAVAVHALHRVPVPAGARVTVLGAGAVGLAVAQLARAGGAAHVTVVGTRPGPLALAARLGADATVDLSAGGRPPPGAEVVFETAGGRDLLQRAAAAAGPGAAIGLVGESFEPQILDAASAMARELTLAFVWSYGSWGGRSEYAWALDLVAAGRATLAPAVTHRFPLERIGEAFDAALDRARSGAVKVLLEP